MSLLPFLKQCLHAPVFAVVWMLAGGVSATARANPPPADGILDETRALTPETRRQISEELKQLSRDLKCEAWLTACSFTPAGMTVRRLAQTRRREWSGVRPAVLMAYDRASSSSGVSFSPDFWERYPAAELVECMQEVRRILADTKLTLDERLALATRAWCDRLRNMESVRLKQSLWLQRREKPFALMIPGFLAGGAMLAALLGLASRRRSEREGRRFFFPEVEVGLRFGAAYGGGVAAEMKTQAGAQ